MALTVTAEVFDITVERGQTFQLVVALLDEARVARTDLADFTGTMQIRSEKDPGTALLATATVVVDADNAQAVATIAKATTAGYEWKSGWYDLVITDGTTSERVVEGRATLSRNVTT